MKAGARCSFRRGAARAAALLAAAGCAVLDRPPPAPMAFDQREFRMPGEAYRPKGWADAFRLRYGPSGKLFEDRSARLVYAAAAGQEEAEDLSPPLFMLDGEHAEKVQAALRRVRGGHTLCLTNPSRDEALAVALHLDDYRARTALLNPVDGKTLVIRHGDDGAFRIALAPGQTWVVCFGEFARAFVFDGVYAPPGPRKVVATLDGAWRGKLDATVNLPHHARGGRYLLAFPTCEADVLRVTVNHITCAPVFAAPWEADISAALREGPNTVRIELENGLGAQAERGRDEVPPVIVEEERARPR